MVLTQFVVPLHFVFHVRKRYSGDAENDSYDIRKHGDCRVCALVTVNDTFQYRNSVLGCCLIQAPVAVAPSPFILVAVFVLPSMLRLIFFRLSMLWLVLGYPAVASGVTGRVAA